MQQTPGSSRRALGRRAVSLLLALALTLGLVPGFPGASGGASAHWADPYLSQLVEWGFIRADQAGSPDRALTRADFMAIVNRAYGYHVPGPTPFTDVSEKDWYYDDVGIAYTARYINGTSPTTASPNATLDRETAATILGRNMMLQESAGEILDFTDARRISNWAMGTIKSSLEHYLVSGYDDGTFRPQRPVTWGEMAALISRTVGTPLQEAGDYSLGGVFGNVTVTSPGVTLRDTVIGGDLYITGGVGLGGVKLENVTVLGRIIASGTGASEGGASILLRNVTADELLVDNLQDNEVSIRADGVTEIGKTTVRTSAYIEDNTPDGLGLHMISLEGDSYGEDEEVPEGWEPPRLTLAGRVEEVVNRTPNSTVHVAKGTVAKLTVDEEAEGSDVVIDRGAVVKDLILDTGVSVTGEGDIVKLEVNTPGSNVAMIPDEIYIRPGITAIIAGEEMDSTSAEEFSLEPLILAGYPKASDVTPTSLEAVFSTNKKGRIYWAVSTVTDGSVGADELLKPPSYGNIAVKWGTVDSPRGNEETTARITGLQPDGSYYLSAVLEDARGQLSPVKVISFTTPDNTVPAFAQGYPHMSKTSRTDSVAVVMPTKDCKLYYALLPQGAVAPTENELKTGAVSGALGYGVRDVTKNTEDAFRVNDAILDEQVTYVLYLWLVDANGANKSAIVSLPFTTADETPPEFIIDPSISAATVRETGVDLTFRLNEDGTVYWVAVPVNDPYPQPQPGSESVSLTSPWAKTQVSSGLGIGARGKSGSVKAAKDATGDIRVTGLDRESYYDFYYVAIDAAGNYSRTVKKITIHTLDATAPTVRQSFDPASETGGCKVNSDIRVEFSEDVVWVGDGTTNRSLTELWDDVKNSTGAANDTAVNRLAKALYNGVRLYKFPLDATPGEQPEDIPSKWQVDDKNPFTDKMLVDYTQARVEDHRRENKGVWVVIPKEAVNLVTGEQYCFRVADFTDTSSKRNHLAYEPVYFWEWDKTTKDNAVAGGYDMDVFIVDFAGAGLKELKLRGEWPKERDGDGKPKTTDADVHRAFTMTPDTTGLVDPVYAYDLLLWTDRPVEYNLYYRIKDTNITTGDTVIKDFSAEDANDTATKKRTYSDYLLNPTDTSAAGKPDTNGWMLLGESGVHYNAYDEANPEWAGKSVGTSFIGLGQYDFPKLVNMREGLVYEFAISLTKWDGKTDPAEWVGDTTMQVRVDASRESEKLRALGDRIKYRDDDVRPYWEAALNSGVLSIGSAGAEKYLQLEPITRVDTKVPEFYGEYPRLDPEPYNVDMGLRLTHEGTIWWAVSEISNGTPLVTTQVWDEGAQQYRAIKQEEIPKTWPAISSAEEQLPQPNPPVKMPRNQANVTNPESADEFVASSSVKYTSSVVPVKLPKDDLKPNTSYCAYFVLKGAETEFSQIYVYQFTTKRSPKPQITITNNRNSSVNILTEKDISSNYWYLVCAEESMLKIDPLNQPFVNYLDDTGNYIPDGKALPSYYNGYTVLEALMKGYGDTCEDARSQSTNPNAWFPTESGYLGTDWVMGASVFDVYASAAVRGTVYGIVASASTGTVPGLGSDEIFDAKKNTTTAKNERLQPIRDRSNSEMGSGSYTILVVAQNQKWSAMDEQTNGGKSAFRAAVIDNTTAGVPKLIGASMGPPSTTETDNKYSGSITLFFNSDLYKKGTDDPIDSGDFMADAGPNNGTMSINPNKQGLTSTYYLTFTNHRIGTAISSTDVLYNRYGGANLTLYVGSRQGSDTLNGTNDDGTPRKFIEYTVYWGRPGTQDERHRDFYKSEPFKFYIDELDPDTTTEVTGFTVTSDKDGKTDLTSATLNSAAASQYAYAILTPATGTESAVVQWDHGDVVNIRSNTGVMHDVVIERNKVGQTTIDVSVKDALLPSKQVTVTVQGKLDNLRAASGLTSAPAEGGIPCYTWTRTNTSQAKATLSFDTLFPVSDESLVSVTSSDSTKVQAVKKASNTAATSGIELTWPAGNIDGEVTITVSGASGYWESGYDSRQIKIKLVGPTASLTDPTLKANSDASTIPEFKLETAGTYTARWVRPSTHVANDTYAATLTFDTVVDVNTTQIDATSADPDKVAVGTVTKDESSPNVIKIPLTYKSGKGSTVEITITLKNGSGTVVETRKIKITLDGPADVPAVTPTTTSGY